MVVTYITYETKNQDMNALRQLADQWRQKAVSDLFVAASDTDGKVNMLAAVSQEKLEQGLKAGDLIKTLAPFAGGKGRRTPRIWHKQAANNPAGIPGCAETRCGLDRGKYKISILPQGQASKKDACPVFFTRSASDKMRNIQTGGK